MAAQEVASPTPSTEAATPATGPAPSATGTVPNGSEAGPGQSAPTEESFTNVDPNSLPPELRSKYDNMLRDYKSKTQQIADERRAIDGKLKKADVLEQLEQHPKYPELVRFWNGLTNKEQQAVVDQQNGEQNGQARPERPTAQEWDAARIDPSLMPDLIQREIQAERHDLQGRHAELQREQAAVKQSMLQRDAREILDAYADAKDEKGEKLHPDFDELAEKGLIPMFLDKMDAQDKRDMSKAVSVAYQKAKEVADHFYSKGKNSALGTIQQKATQSTEPPSITAGETYNGTDPKKISVKEAILLGKKGVRVTDAQAYK